MCASSTSPLRRGVPAGANPHSSAFGAAQPQQRGPLVVRARQLGLLGRDRCVRTLGIPALDTRRRVIRSTMLLLLALHCRTRTPSPLWQRPRCRHPASRHAAAFVLVSSHPCLLRLRPVRAVGVHGLPGSARAVAALIGWSEEAQDADAGGEDGRVVHRC